ncbi:ISNCY family transposase [Sphingobium sufflavum]|uniref:ISNCY family transposase n=1 Tax=Sphingobium sufflavum TaxID=1129547 RepID=UPI001F1C34E5|nr:ISNCY family transposase [Sphingobium sufflavum]MCE7798002.1 ISNCY family transposase [Sphingobium sufflavum]
MSHGELSRYDTLRRFERGELRIEDAAILLGVSGRQVYRLLGRLRADGPEALVSWKRGRPSNRDFGDDFRVHVLSLVREHYHDFGPTLISEYLAERHGITLSHETLRKWMIKSGMWKDREARRPRPYQPRYRRDCRGELIQIDGSKHWWFEDRGPQCTFAYKEATREYIERHGKPVAFYSDKHSVFRNNTASAKGDGMTHFGRAMEALAIEIICAHSPQAKGRVERANGTLQDRLVKAMRLEGIATIAEANAFLPGYMARHNARFARPPFDPRDLHRPLALHDDLRAEMVWREHRTVTAALTLHYNKALFVLDPTEISRPLAGKRVEVCEYPDGRLEIRHESHALPYRMFDKIRQVNQAAIVENKHLDAALAMAKAMQEMLPPRKRNNNEPCRRSQGSHQFPTPEPTNEMPVKRKRGRPPLRRLTPIEAAQRIVESR